MALSNAYVQVYGQLGDVFSRIAEGQAPDKFTTQYLKDLGFASSNFRWIGAITKTFGSSVVRDLHVARDLGGRQRNG